MIIETSVLNYLISRNLSVGSSIYMEVPEDPEDEYILIEKIGGGRSDQINMSRIDIQSCSKISMERVLEINEEVISAMDEYAYNTIGVFGCDLNYNNNFTNPTTKIYRYQAGFNIYF